MSSESGRKFGIILSSREVHAAYPPSEASCEAAARAVCGVIVRETGNPLGA